MSLSDDAIVFLVLDIAHLVRRRFDRALEESGLGVSPGDARVLLRAHREPGLRQAVLAERMNIEPMTLVGYLDRLEAAGLVARVPDPGDRRAKLVTLTEAADGLAEKIEAISLRVRETATAELGERQINAMRDGLRSMRDALADEKKVEPA